MSEVTPAPEVVAQLAAVFHRNGYVRWPNWDRRASDGYVGYKKGYEVRLVASSTDELAAIRVLLARAGFRLARPFTKARQWRQPVYGRPAVARFLHLIGWSPDAEPGVAPDPARDIGSGRS